MTVSASKDLPASVTAPRAQPLIEVPLIDSRISVADMTRATVLARGKYPQFATQFKGPLTAALDEQTGAKTFTFEASGTSIDVKRVETGTDTEKAGILRARSNVVTNYVKLPVSEEWRLIVTVTLQDKSEPRFAEQHSTTQTGVVGPAIPGVDRIRF